MHAIDLPGGRCDCVGGGLDALAPPHCVTRPLCVSRRSPASCALAACVTGTVTPVQRSRQWPRHSRRREADASTVLPDCFAQSMANLRQAVRNARAYGAPRMSITRSLRAAASCHAPAFRPFRLASACATGETLRKDGGKRNTPSCAGAGKRSGLDILEPGQHLKERQPC
jgi:hypothetical protein